MLDNNEIKKCQLCHRRHSTVIYDYARVMIIQCLLKCHRQLNVTIRMLFQFPEIPTHRHPNTSLALTL